MEQTNDDNQHKLKHVPGDIRNGVLKAEAQNTGPREMTTEKWDDKLKVLLESK